MYGEKGTDFVLSSSEGASGGLFWLGGELYTEKSDCFGFCHQLLLRYCNYDMVELSEAIMSCFSRLSCSGVLNAHLVNLEKRCNVVLFPF